MAVIAGLGASAWDITAVGDTALNFPLWGAMGGAAMIGLGPRASRSPGAPCWSSPAMARC